MSANNGHAINPFFSYGKVENGEIVQVLPMDTCILCDEPIKPQQKLEGDARCVLCEADIGGTD